MPVTVSSASLTLRSRADLSGGRACLGFPRLPAKRELFQHFPGKMLLCQSISPPLFAFAMTGFFCQYDEALALTMIFLQ